MKLSLYSGNLSTYYKSITLAEGKKSCKSLIINGLQPSCPKYEKSLPGGIVEAITTTTSSSFSPPWRVIINFPHHSRRSKVFQNSLKIFEVQTP